MKLLLPLILLNFIFSQYSIIQSDSKVEYSGKHPMHAFKGQSSAIILYSNCSNKDNSICDLKFKVPIISLNSGNDNRDSNMLNYLEAFSYPEIILEAQDFEIKEFSSKLNSFEFTIHGVSQVITIPLTIKKINSNHYQVQSKFSILLDEFNIPVPKLLFIPIDNEIRVNVSLLIKEDSF